MKQKPTDYRNRIKALEYVNAADLTPHPGNWRAHPAAQAGAPKSGLAEVGITRGRLAYPSRRPGGGRGGLYRRSRQGHPARKGGG